MRTRRISVLLLLSLALAAHGRAQSENYKPFPATWQQALDQYTNKQNPNAAITPGAVVIIQSPQWGTRVGTSGYANIETKVAPRPDHHFRVGSVTKMFVAQTVLALEQQGKLKLNDQVAKYLSDDPTVMAIPNISLMTIGMLMQHISGMANYLGNPTIGSSYLTTPTRAFTPNELMAALAPNSTPVLSPFFMPLTGFTNPYWTLTGSAPPEPGQYPSWFYSNSNYILLGMIIEEVTGKPVQDAIEQYVIKPLGLTDTYFALDPSIPADMMHGYTHQDWTLQYREFPEWKDVTVLNPSYAWSAGAIVSTPSDLLRFAKGIFETNTILNAGTKRKWLNFTSADMEWFNVDYGVGGIMQPHRMYGDARGHGGAIPGYKTLVYHFFDTDTYFIEALNTMDQYAPTTPPEVAILDTLMPLVQGTAMEPGATPARDSVTLTWQPGMYYGEFNVYVGADCSAVENGTTGLMTKTTQTPKATFTGLKPDTDYCWRVDSVPTPPLAVLPVPLDGPPNVPSLVQGLVWRFHTAAQ
ncbi:MAG TPA: serine hydrolase domain-containing protein [Thermoanaerobaculia bacterium]|jgi:CubicO group peptidase (beta-lactamase class C family)